MSASTARPYTQLHRADFHEILAAKARSFKPDVVNLNHTVTGFTENEDGVELTFANGKSAKGDILIGADGLKSVVRRQMFGDQKATYTGDAAWRVVVPVERLPKDFHGAGDVGVHGGRVVTPLSIISGPERC